MYSFFQYTTKRHNHLFSLQSFSKRLDPTDVLKVGKIAECVNFPFPDPNFERLSRWYFV